MMVVRIGAIPALVRRYHVEKVDFTSEVCLGVYHVISNLVGWIFNPDLTPKMQPIYYELDSNLQHFYQPNPNDSRYLIKIKDGQSVDHRDKKWGTAPRLR